MEPPAPPELGLLCRSGSASCWGNRRLCRTSSLSGSKWLSTLVLLCCNNKALSTALCCKIVGLKPPRLVRRPSVLFRKLKILQLILWSLSQLPQFTWVHPCVRVSIYRERRSMYILLYHKEASLSNYLFITN